MWLLCYIFTRFLCTVSSKNCCRHEWLANVVSLQHYEILPKDDRTVAKRDTRRKRKLEHYVFFSSLSLSLSLSSLSLSSITRGPCPIRFLMYGTMRSICYCNISSDRCITQSQTLRLCMIRHALVADHVCLPCFRSRG